VATNFNGDYIVAGGQDSNVYLFGKLSSTPLWNFTAGGQIGENNYPQTIAISDNGNYIAAGTLDFNIYVFRNTQSTPLFNFTTGGEINCLAISSDGAYIAAACRDFNIYLLYNELPAPPTKPAIPFGNIFVFFVIISIVCLIIIKRKNIYIQLS